MAGAAPQHSSPRCPETQVRLNQIEIWFSILSGKSLKASVPEVIAYIDAFIANYNEDARPFVWPKEHRP